jgi:hypothetical protein
MTLTHFEAIIALLSAILAVLGVLAAGMRWIYQQGASSTKLINAIDENTKATARLSGSFKEFSDKTDGSLLDLEQRVARIEGRLGG